MLENLLGVEGDNVWPSDCAKNCTCISTQVRDPVNCTNTVALIYLSLQLVSSKRNVRITLLLKMLYSSLKNNTYLNCGLLQPNPIQLTDNSRGGLVTGGLGELLEMELVAFQ